MAILPDPRSYFAGPESARYKYTKIRYILHYFLNDLRKTPSNKLENYEQCSQTFMYNQFLCFKSGIKVTDGDFRSSQPAMELCSISNCEKLDDSAENISKIERCITTY